MMRVATMRVAARGLRPEGEGDSQHCGQSWGWGWGWGWRQGIGVGVRARARATVGGSAEG
eukprot:5065965-Prymnesium_polylepis.1